MKERIHDNENGKYACNPAIKVNPKKISILQEKVNCIDCLKLIVKEWERQVREFSGQPLKNAKVGLKLARKQSIKTKEKQ